MRCEYRSDGVDATNSISYPNGDRLASAFGGVSRVGANSAAETGDLANLREKLLSFLVEPFNPAHVPIGLGLVTFHTEFIEAAAVRAQRCNIGQLIAARTHRRRGSGELKRRNLLAAMAEKRRNVCEPRDVRDVAVPVAGRGAAADCCW